MLEYKGYHTTMTYDSDDNVYFGRIIGIFDFVGFHAGSIDEFEKAFHRAVDNYLDFYEEQHIQRQKCGIKEKSNKGVTS